MQDQYVDPQLTWPDVNCAHKLCFKGVCKYNVKEEAALEDAWLCRHVTPQITAAFGKKVGAILAKPLLWASFNSVWSERIQPDPLKRICGEFIKLERDLGDNVVNPITKVEVIPCEGTSSLDCVLFPIDKLHRLTQYALAAFANNPSWRHGNPRRNGCPPWRAGRWEWRPSGSHKGEQSLESSGSRETGQDNEDNPSDPTASVPSYG